MSEENKPVFVGMEADESDPIVGGAAARYAEGIKKRRGQVQERNKGPAIPDPAVADANWRASEDGAATPAKLQKALENLNTPEPLQSASEEAAMRQARDDAESAESVGFFGEEGLEELIKAKEPEAPKEKVERPEDEEEEDEEFAELLSRADVLELRRVLNQVNSDVINNKEQRALADAKANAEDPINIATIISTGEAMQWVSINKAFRVRFRQPSEWETFEIRRLLKMMGEVTPGKGDEDDAEIPAFLETEAYGLMVMVAAIYQINDQRTPAHLKGLRSKQEFDPAQFLRKFYMIAKMPGAVTSALRAHAWWFDLRVRQAFTMDSLKNG